LVPALGLNIAYVKRDAHRFEMDKPGKDTHTLAVAGAAAVFISDSRSRALIRRQPIDPQLARLDFLEEDAVLVEGHKHTSVPKIVVLDDALAIIADPAFQAQLPLAAVGPFLERPRLPWTVPYFHRDDVASIAAFIRGYWDSLTDARPILGLVLTGGLSSRMGTDKAALDYGHGEETRRIFRLLEEFCAQSFVSCRADQADLSGRRGLPQIHDRMLGMGPLSGILSAFEARANATWLVVACDHPRLDREVLATLVKNRNPYRFATVFRDTGGRLEPLCTLYEPKSRSRLYQFLAAGYDSPHKMLINSPVEVLAPPDGDQLVDVDYPEERQEALHYFRS
jgi:molybdopterin-guanine dinucleotide biosynthesis protein MobB